MVLAVREWADTVLISTVHTVQHFFRSLIPPLIPVLLVDLGLPLWQLGGLVSVYSLATGVGQAPFGELSDRYDRSYVLAGGLLVMSVGFGSMGLAPVLGRGLPDIGLGGSTVSGTFLVMGVGMFVGGLGTSVTHPTGYPLLSANVSPARQGRSLGIWGGAAKFGDALAPAVVGVAILATTWDRILLVAGLAGGAYVLVFTAVLRRSDVETRPAGRLPDAGGGEPASDGTSRGSGLHGVDRRLVLYPLLIVLAFFLVRGAAGRGINTFVPVFITDVYGYTLTAGGVHMGPESLASFYFSALLLFSGGVQLVAGGLTDRYDHRAVIVAFFLVAAAGLLVLSTVRLGPVALLAVLFVVGGSVWGANPARDTLITEIAPDGFEGRTFGYLWTVSGVIGSVWPVAIGGLAALVGIQAAFGFLAVSALAAAGVVGLLYSDRVYLESGRPSRGAETTD